MNVRKTHHQTTAKTRLDQLIKTRRIKQDNTS